MHRVKREPLLSLSLSLPFSSHLSPFSTVFQLLDSSSALCEAMESETSPESEGQSGKCLWRKDALGPCLNIGELEIDCWHSV